MSEMEWDFKGKTALVTGGAGSIGSEIVKQLLVNDVAKVIIFSRDEIKHFLLKKRLNDSRIDTIVGDVRDYRSLEVPFLKNKIDIVFHAAAMKHVVVAEEAPLECVKTNILGTYNVVDLAKKHNVQKMITISTDKSACPVNTMGATKFIAENITLNADYSCVRFGNVANSRGSVIPVLIDNILTGKPLTITDPNITRFMISIPDAVRLVLTAAKYSQGGDIFILKMRAFRLGDLLDVILERIVPKLDTSEDIKINVVGALLGEKEHEDLINSTESGRIFDLQDMYLVLRDPTNAGRYPNVVKTSLERYSSDDVEMLSKEELEGVVDSHIKQLAHRQIVGL